MEWSVLRVALHCLLFAITLGCSATPSADENTSETPADANQVQDTLATTDAGSSLPRPPRAEDTLIQDASSSDVSDTSGPAVEPCDLCGPEEVCVNDECQPPCVPQCGANECGADGCGGVCGTCGDTFACLDNLCVALCGPCTEDTNCPPTYTCATDPLGTLNISFCAPPCEEGCPAGFECTQGASHCVASPILQCQDGDIYTGTTCGDIYWLNEDCPAPTQCNPDTLTCTCAPSNCENRECGTNGCPNGNCGECAAGEDCVNGICCAPNCYNRVCGDDGCGRSCGLCLNGDTCTEDGTCCTPINCGDKECGEDENGCPCGTCGENGTCVEGTCECTPDCSGKSCGPDGCGGTCGCCSDDLGCNEGECASIDPCGGCPPEFTCEDNGLCTRPAEPGCWDIVTDAPLSFSGECLNSHTIRYCDENRVVILDCTAPNAKRRQGDVAAGAIWCDRTPGTQLYDCVPTPPCQTQPCFLSIPTTAQGCPSGALCGETGTCEPCDASCETFECGTNACGFPCGTCLTTTWSSFFDTFLPAQTCGDTQTCDCTPLCAPLDALPCGDDSCGGSCGACPEGDQWSCGETKTCVCAPLCENNQCGDDSCNGLCGPTTQWLSAEQTDLNQSLASCPGDSVCVENFCTTPTGALCGWPEGEPIEEPTSFDGIVGYGGTDTLPEELADLISNLIEQGNPCSEDCTGPLVLHEAFTYTTDVAIPPEDEETDVVEWETEPVRTLLVLHHYASDTQVGWNIHVAHSPDTGVIGIYREAVFWKKTDESNEVDAEAWKVIKDFAIPLFEAEGLPLPAALTSELALPITPIFRGCSAHHQELNIPVSPAGGSLQLLLTNEWVPISSHWSLE